MNIPKIIHQTAPKDRSDWHPIWEKCHLSWKEQFSEPEYEHIFWNDDDIDNLIRESYPQYLHFYEHLPFHIMKIDFARFCILHKYGGIYADMDMYCYQNFYSDLKEEFYLVESICGFETVQNSLMVSKKENVFFKQCIEETVIRFKPFIKKITPALLLSSSWCPYVIKTTGPKILSEIFNSQGGTVKNILPSFEYNQHHLFYDKRLKTRHMLTGRWGKDVIQSERNFAEKQHGNISYDEYVINSFINFRDININDFDFYKNYY
jgi:mannosyltransferase OCH1-like enzyme